MGSDESVASGAIPSNMRLWQTSLLTRETFSFQTFPEQACYLCLFGHLAPNTHNTQPWRFSVADEQRMIAVYLDRSFVLPASDVAGRQAVVSVGCAIEHIAVAAHHFGLEPVVETISVEPQTVRSLGDDPKAPRYIALAMIRLSASRTAQESPYEEHLVRSMFSRKTVRAEFDATLPIPDELLESLRQLSRGSGAQIHTLTGSHPGKRMLAELQGQVDAYVINSPTFRRELGEWVLPNDTESGIGMPGIGFGLDDAEAIRIRDGLLERGSLYPDDGLKFAMAGKRGIETAPLVGLVTVPQESVSAWLDAGRILAYALLLLECQGYHSATNAGIVEVSLIRRMFQMLFRISDRLVILFRTGRVKNPQHAERPHSPRRPLNEVILDVPPQV